MQVRVLGDNFLTFDNFNCSTQHLPGITNAPFQVHFDASSTARNTDIIDTHKKSFL